MKHIRFFLFIVSILIFSSAIGQVKAGTIVRRQVAQTKDSIEYYETDFIAKQKSHLDLLLGSWTIKTMKRQARMNVENLMNVSLELKDDSTFTGSAGCNTISGRFSIKGNSIKFTNTRATRMACDRIEQEGWVLKLLENTVSSYVVENETIVLKDGSANSIFEGVRDN